ncbi:MAG: hypothetical protein LBH43_02425, partial [Treponema sp.]|nr:hypothetical protein [Treponema sp.]
MTEAKQKKVFGYFNSDGSEYTVTEPDTPIPFVNYYWNSVFISGASQHLAGIGCFNARPIQYMHPECRALLVNNENRHFYMRDKDTGGIWSPGWYPTLTPLDSYACAHGLGYSRISSSRTKIDIQLRLFVPEKEPCEIWTLTVKNSGEAHRNIQSFAFVEWLLKGYPEYCDYHSGLQSVYDEASSVLICYNKSSERNHDFYNGFIASDARPAGLEKKKKAFMGYGQVDRPKA